MAIIALAALWLVWGSASPSHALDSMDANREKVSIELGSNASTGYSWSYTVDKPDIIKEMSSRYVDGTVPRGHPLAGAPGKQVFVFTGQKPGKVLVTFSYARPWEKGLEPAQSAVYIIEVYADGRLAVVESADHAP